jgi:hypothetical protein
MSTITIPLNQAPYCSRPSDSASCIQLDRSESVFPDSNFQINSLGWADPENSGLTYEFGLLTDLGRQLLLSARDPAFSLAGLMPGSNTLYVCAVDEFGAKTCQEAQALVQEPEGPFSDTDVDDQISLMNIPSLDDTLDAPSLIGAALKMASLISYNAANAVHESLADGGGLHFLKDSSSSSAWPSIQRPAAASPTARNATNWLMSIMSKAGAGNDAEKMNSLLGAGARLSRSSQLDSDGGLSLLQLFRYDACSPSS